MTLAASIKRSRNANAQWTSVARASGVPFDCSDHGDCGCDDCGCDDDHACDDGHGCGNDGHGCDDDVSPQLVFGLVGQRSPCRLYFSRILSQLFILSLPRSC
jgi:hypothetical protein